MLAAQMVQFDGGSVEAKPKWGFPKVRGTFKEEM